MTTPILLALRRGLVYEGDGNFFRAVHPIPVLTRAVCDWLLGADQKSRPTVHLFREDSFDPVTRVRRGRLYQVDDSWGSKTIASERVHNYPFGPHIGAEPGWAPDTVYIACRSADAVRSRPPLGSRVALGASDCQTFWRLADVERISNGDTLLTLRAVSSLGALPELAAIITDQHGAAVDPESIQAALNKVVDAFHVQQPTPLVDVCRETVRVVLAAWMGAQASGADLGAVLKNIPGECVVLTSAAQIVSRMHPRGKSAEQERQTGNGYHLRSPTYDDAQACVQLLGLALRELGWAAS